jgi:hypothetical protein
VFDWLEQAIGAFVITLGSSFGIDPNTSTPAVASTNAGGITSTPSFRKVQASTSW